MGIRINKALGYGLTNVANKDHEITDPRINADSFLLSGEVPPIEDYIAFVERTAGKDEGHFEALLEARMLQEYTGRDADSQGLCIWRCEYGLPEVLLLRPFGFTGWYRHDDPIDYEEAALRGATMECQVERTIGGIYPWNGLHMDIRTGRRIQGNLVNAWRQVVNAGAKDDKDDLPLLNHLAQAMGCKDHAEAEQCIVPLVPDEIRRVCEWGQLFTSPEVCFELRPLLYTYWG